MNTDTDTDTDTNTYKINSARPDELVHTSIDAELHQYVPHEISMCPASDYAPGTHVIDILNTRRRYGVVADHDESGIYSDESGMVLVPVRWDGDSYDMMYNVSFMNIIPHAQYRDYAADHVVLNDDLWDCMDNRTKLGYVRRKYPGLYAAMDVPARLEEYIHEALVEEMTSISNFL